MDANVNNLFLEVQEPSTSCSQKRPSKSRSRVWEKVVWFTRKAKGVKDSKNTSPEVQKSNNNTNVDCAVSNCKTFGVEKSENKQKVRKTRSFKYLKRRKVRQFGHELSSEAVEEEVNVQDCGTATGTFHDFQSERRISRHERTTSNNSLLSEIARGMNSSQQKVQENVKSALSLPLDDLSLSEGPISDSLSPNFPRVRRSVSFSGPAYNSWPRKKRTYLRNSGSRVELLSPPVKQKCVSGIRKRASFSGFDSSKINLKNSYLSLYKGVKSTPHLPQGGHIRNQNGLTIGAIHFYKSPAIYQKDETTLKLFQRKSQTRQADGESGVYRSTDGTEMGKDRTIDTVLPRESDTISFTISETNENSNNIANCSMSGEHNCQSNSTCEGQTSSNDVTNSTNNCLSFHIKSSDMQNSTISAFLLEGECSSSCCMTTSPVDSSDEDSVKEKPLVSAEKGTPVNSTDESILTRDNGINYTVLESNIHENGPIRRLSNGSDEAMDIPEYYSKTPELETKENVSCSPQIHQDNTLPVTVSDVISANNKENTDIFNATQHDTCRTVALSSLPTVDEVSKVDMTPTISCSYGNPQTLQAGNKMLWQRKPTVNGEQFKKYTEDILHWFREFNDEQRNILIKRLLEECELPQMHMLSVAMEPVLHKSCPPNCQDMLSWLPHHVALHVLSFLDSVSLCRCSQVNCTWNNLASSPLLWQNLCGRPNWQLSRIGEEKEKKKYTMKGGTVQWKKMFASRFLLHQNWLKGKCDVRTFEGHTQGISCVQFDDTRIASGSYDKTIRVWDIQSGDCDAVLTLAGHSGTVRCLNLNGNRLVSGSVDRSIKVWDLSFESYWSGASCKVTMVGHMHTVRCLQVDDKKVVSGSYDKTLKVWDIKTGNCQLTLRGHNAAVLCVQFDERKIVSGSYDKTIKVWSLTEGSCLMTLTGHHDAVTCLNLTFDSRKVISGSLDHNLKFWDLLNGKCIGTLDWIRSEGHTGVIRCLQTDSWRIVSAGDDKTLKMWSLESGQRLLTLRCHTDGVTCLQFNDYSIVSGSYDKTVKLWDFTPSHEFLTPG
ncbi:hypothetical protein ACROYT_G032627 [Oculina patagonica]